MGSVQGGGGLKNLNRPTGNTQPKRNILILRRKGAGQPSRYFLELQPREYERTGTAPEASVPSQVICVVDDSDFLRIFAVLNSRQRSLEPRHARKYHRGLFGLHDPL